MTAPMATSGPVQTQPGPAVFQAHTIGASSPREGISRSDSSLDESPLPKRPRKETGSGLDSQQVDNGSYALPVIYRPAI